MEGLEILDLIEYKGESSDEYEDESDDDETVVAC